MNQEATLAKSANTVQEALKKLGLSYRVVELLESTRTAQEAASTIGCEVAQIVKSLIFKTKISQKPVLILASGINRINEKCVEMHIKEQIIKADAEFTREVTGFAIGGISPIGHRQNIPWIFIDEDLLQFEAQ